MHRGRGSLPGWPGAHMGVLESHTHRPVGTCPCLEREAWQDSMQRPQQ